MESGVVTEHVQNSPRLVILLDLGALCGGSKI